MIGSVHLADVGAFTALGQLIRTVEPGTVPGLRNANLAIAAPLSKSRVAKPQFGRLALIAFWDGEVDLDRFVHDHPLAARFADGWQVRLEPLRMHGSWPGVPQDISSSRTVEYHGPSVVLTLGRLRISQAARFLRTSAKAEGAVVDAPGVIWATGLARPPFVSTCSLWESSKALATYAYGHDRPAHSEAIDADADKPFHHQSAFIRFRPYGATGHLDGRNPLPEAALTEITLTDTAD